MRLTQSILKRKFPSVDKPLRINATPKISPSKRGLIFGILRYHITDLLLEVVIEDTLLTI